MTLVCLLTIGHGLVTESVAQDANLTPEQLIQLQSLPPAQRQALLDSLGGSGSQPAAQVQLSQPVEVMPRTAPSEANQLVQGNTVTQQAADSLVESPVPEVSGQTLEQFGYNLFAGSPTTFAPATNIPVPATYIIGPGDNVIIQLYGQQNVTHNLIVTRDGTLLFPDIGPISVSGQSFEELRQQIDDIVSTQLIGQRASVSLGELRSIRIFVLGEAFRPGSYTVSGLTTITNALFVSGGVTNVGSLRNIQLRRQGETVATLDLYDLLLRGDTSGDVRLMPDDALFIPPIGPTVGVSGEVIRPAIYELNGETTALDILMLAGGLLPTAYPQVSKIERIDEQGQRTVVDVDLSGPLGQAQEIRTGDLLQVNPILDRLENVVLTEGHLNRPGGFQWRPDLRVSDVITSLDSLRPNPDLQYALLVREQQPLRTSQVFKLQLGRAIANPESEFDLVLQPRDRIITFGAVGDRASNLGGLIAELSSEAQFDNPASLISVQGSVRFPGTYPFLENMTVGDVLNSAGGLQEYADASYALIVRRTGNQGRIEVHNAIAGTLSLESERPMARGDELLVFSANTDRSNLLGGVISSLQSQADSAERTKVVTVTGQVKFPGDYPLIEGMTSRDLVIAAGGYSESAQLSDAELSRVTLTSGSGRDVAHTSINPDNSTVILRELDSLAVKQLPNWVGTETVEISGEIVSPGSYPIYKGETLRDVIRRAGGLTAFADANASVLLRATLRAQEQALLNRYQEELEADIAAVAVEESVGDAGDAATLEVGAELLDQIEEIDAQGRLVIDLPGLLAGSESESLIALDGDQLIIPRQRQEISILGEVQFPTSHVYDASLSVQDYLNLSGGLTQRADARRTYIIRANGQVVPFGNSRWFFDRSLKLGPGDAIVVPFDIEPTNYLATWTSVSQVIFSLATTILAINSVQN